MDPSEAYFPDTYLESRVWFRQQLGRVRRFWPSSSLKSYGLKDDPTLTIDWIDAPCPSPEGQVLIVSTGLHGTEGFAGTAVLHHLLDAFLDKFEHARTGLLLVHAVNPWGMHHRRRTNAHNVDLNRNFRFGSDSPTTFENPGYRSLRALLHPEQPIGNLNLATIQFIGGAISKIISNGIAQIKAATLLGQLEDPLGLYFGGLEFQEESRVIWDLVTDQIAEYKQVVHLDIHTGYGARNVMNLVNSVREGTPPDLWAQRLNYPHVVRADPEAFYSMQGDMIDAIYAWTSKNAANHRYFGTAFEFGTVGDKLIAQIRSLRVMVFENRITHHEVSSVSIERAVRGEFKELFDPQSSNWRKTVTQSSDRALLGILEEFEFIHQA